MQQFFDKLNSPKAVIVVLATCLAVNGLLYYTYQKAFGSDLTSAASGMVDVPATDERATAERTPEPDGAGGSEPESSTGGPEAESDDAGPESKGDAGGTEPKNGIARGGSPEEGVVEGETTGEASRSAEPEGDDSSTSGEVAGIAGGSRSESVQVSGASWCAPGAVRGEPTAVVLAASAGRWATVAAVQEISEPVWRRVAVVTGPAWHWLTPVREDNTEVPEQAPTEPSRAPVEDAPEPGRQEAPASNEAPQGPVVEGSSQYSEGESTSTVPQDSTSTLSQGADGTTMQSPTLTTPEGAGGSTSSAGGGATSSAGGGATSSTGGGATSSVSGGATPNAGGATSGAAPAPQ